MMVIVKAISKIETRIRKGGAVGISVDAFRVFVHVASATHNASPAGIVHKGRDGRAVDPNLDAFAEFLNGTLELLVTGKGGILANFHVVATALLAAETLDLFGN